MGSRAHRRVASADAARRARAPRIGPPRRAGLANGPARRHRPPDSDYYINYAAPQAEEADHRQGNEEERRLPAEGLQVRARAGAGDRPQVRRRQPEAARQLAKLEAKAIKENKSPRQIKQAKGTQEAKLLTILVEFNDDGERRLHGRHGPGDRLREPRRASRATCRTARSTTTSRTRPTFTPTDNNTFWVPDFSPAHFNKHAVHEDRHHRARPHGPDRPRRRRRHRHLRLHDEEHVRGDVQGRLHGRWRGHAVGHRPALGGLVRRIALHPRWAGRLDGAASRRR